MIFSPHLILAAAHASIPTVVHTITGFDYGIIGFYVVFMLSLGVLFRRLSKTTSDYFRCGGAMPSRISATSR